MNGTVGYYSQEEVDKGHPTFWYRDESGNQIEVTAVYGPAHDLIREKYPDEVWVGKNLTFIGPGRERTYR